MKIENISPFAGLHYFVNLYSGVDSQTIVKITLIAVPVFLLLLGCCAKKGGASRYSPSSPPSSEKRITPTTTRYRVLEGDLSNNSTDTPHGWTSSPSSESTEYGTLNDVHIVVNDGLSSPTTYQARVPDSNYSPRTGFSLLNQPAGRLLVSPPASPGTSLGFRSVAFSSTVQRFPQPTTPLGPDRLTIPLSEVVVELDFDEES